MTVEVFELIIYQLWISYSACVCLFLESDELRTFGAVGEQAAC